MTVINNSQVNNSDRDNGTSTNTHYVRVGRSSNNIKLPKPLEYCTHNFEINHYNND